ncbi:response regulator [Geobacter sp. AOG2]|uniref:response regulator n=1 Tax=Geobacter sp. AOG2 TaxID=1566347 RepID=UPI001CC37BCD|nr:response regulator [Geobacter sp. AOG2]GFE61275.1 response regulator [Geobacter sp. AOG2]
MNKKTILITDDSTALRAMLVSIIESLGDFRIVEAANGFEALRLLPRERVDLIFTDINMPDINGLELISYLRNNDNYRHIPVIIISTEGRQSDIEKGKLLGANEYIVKPFVCSDLKNIIVKYLDDRQG